ncbi:MAG: hypothetical protein ACTSSI_04750 [Candidatus Helarchaeota archaeon]
MNGITGVFFNEKLVGQMWPIIDDKFEDMPQAMQSALDLPNVQLFESKAIPIEYLSRVHSNNVIESLERAWYCEGALITIGGFMEASEKVLKGELKNAFNFSFNHGSNRTLLEK